MKSNFLLLHDPMVHQTTSSIIMLSSIISHFRVHFLYALCICAHLQGMSIRHSIILPDDISHI